MKAGGRAHPEDPAVRLLVQDLLEQAIKERLHVAPYLLSIGEPAEQVVQAFQTGLLTGPIS
ncbi:MAG TPA: hypothetical protein GX507_08015 [Clostridia bacterium]|nr:hypothetical protein [Clostridia bacterium]